MTTRATPPEVEGDDPLARQLLRQAEAITQLRRDLDELAIETTDTVTNVLTRIEAVEETATNDPDEMGDTGPGTGRGVVLGWCWRHLGPQGADALWTELTSWVAWIRSRYPLARRVPACWDAHPEAVEELTALWLAWQAAYTDRDAQLTAAADWHDRWLPGVLYRLEHGPFALDCGVTHHDRPASAYAESVGDESFSF